MNLAGLLLLSAQTSQGGAGHPSTLYAGTSIPCEVQWETAPSLKDQLPWGHGSAPPCCTLGSSTLSFKILGLGITLGLLASHFCPGSVSPLGSKPSVCQQQSCHINLSALGEQCTGLISIHLGLNAVSGSKPSGPISNLYLSVILGRMLSHLQPRAGGR